MTTCLQAVRGPVFNDLQRDIAVEGGGETKQAKEERLGHARSASPSLRGVLRVHRGTDGDCR